MVDHGLRWQLLRRIVQGAGARIAQLYQTIVLTDK
jgi:hypothetical protein